MKIQKPFDLLGQSIGNQVLVQMKGNKQIRGVLQAFDQHMNIVLSDAEELEEGEVKAKIGYVIVRGDTIVYVSPSV